MTFTHCDSCGRQVDKSRRVSDRRYSFDYDYGFEAELCEECFDAIKALALKAKNEGKRTVAASKVVEVEVPVQVPAALARRWWRRS